MEPKIAIYGKITLFTPFFGLVIGSDVDPKTVWSAGIVFPSQFHVKKSLAVIIGDQGVV